uniref:IS1182 family transposase n=2 Tax=Gemmatimonas sp. TaxID=1962908 RepID=UPI00286D9B0E
MARYKVVDTNPQFLSVDLARQLLPGTFEHALNHLLDHEVDLAHFDARFKNDATGAPAYPPAMLLKVVLFAYSQGIVRSRAIERVCQEHVTFMALCGMTAPHFTTIAHFVSSLRDDIAQVFAAVLAVCDGQGLIGREMFAIDGVKLPSNASKHRSGTRAEFTQRAEKLEAAAKTMLDRHRATDAQEREPDVAAKTTARVARLTKDAEELRAWLANHPTDRHGPTGGLRKSNRTDNESAKMATDKGVIQGYTGVAGVDAKHQIIVDAQAHGTGSEQELLLPVVEALASLRTNATVLTADAGYQSEANLAVLAERSVTALIADPDMRKRDERFADREHHTTAPNPLHDKSGDAKKTLPVFAPSDFTYDAEARTCVCPAGKSLNRRGARNVTNGYVGEHFQGAKRDCAPCALRDKCLRTPETTVVRNVAFFRGREDAEAETHTMRMQQRLDTPEGREQYGRRFATVEPVFANVRYNKRLDRFTLRGRTKVNGQWLLFCLVHNIEKLTHA